MSEHIKKSLGWFKLFMVWVLVCTHTHIHTYGRMHAHLLACTLLYISHLCKLELVNSPECDRHKQAYETASHVLCDCKTLDFMKPGDLEEICVIRILHFVQKYQVWSRCMCHYCARPSLFSYILLFSVLFYSILYISSVQSSVKWQQDVEQVI
jgi:hypothetical protein